MQPVRGDEGGRLPVEPVELLPRGGALQLGAPVGLETLRRGEGRGERSEWRQW